MEYRGPLKSHSPITSSGFSMLFEQYKTHFVAVARSYVRDPMVAEDLVMDSFISFWENRDKIEITQTIPVYILISVKRRCLNWLRDQSTHLRAQKEIHSTALRIISARMETIEMSEPNSVYLEEISAIIKREFEKMPEQTRRVFLANRFEDMTYKEISEKFGISYNQVNFEIRKATQIFRLSLKDYLPLLIALKLAYVFL